MTFRKTGSVTGTVTGVEGVEGLPPVTAAEDDPWGGGDDEGLAAENDRADA